MDMTQSFEPVEKLQENPIKKNLWSIDSVAIDGQTQAGEVDKSQEEFLKNTTMVD